MTGIVEQQILQEVVGLRPVRLWCLIGRLAHTGRLPAGAAGEVAGRPDDTLRSVTENLPGDEHNDVKYAAPGGESKITDQ